MKETTFAIKRYDEKNVNTQNAWINRERQVENDWEEQQPRMGCNRCVKMDFPHFDSTNLPTWLFKASQDFAYHQTLNQQRLFMLSYYMEVETLVQYQDAVESGTFTSQETFAHATLIKFGPIAYNNPIKALTRLKQTSTIANQKAQCESLSNRLRGLSESHKLSYFLSGLKDEIRLSVRMFNPTSLNAAYGLAKIQEEYLLSTQRGPKFIDDKCGTV